MVRGTLSLISDPVTGQGMLPGHSDGPFLNMTVMDPPDAMLHGGKEHVMIIPVNQEHQRVLLKLPNKLGWRFHFGCLADEHPAQQISHALHNVLQFVRPSTVPTTIEHVKLREAGLMFFTFRGTDTVAAHSPMRVKVYTTNIEVAPPLSSLQQEQIKDLSPCNTNTMLIPFEGVPYDQMWADDEIWMPSLLSNPESYFEAHFVFDGPPGTQAPILGYNYKVYDEEE